MKIESAFTQQPAAWSPLTLGSGEYRHWLRDHGSLTRRLQQSCERFSVEDVRQRWGRPGWDESSLLGLRRKEHALLREVSLCCNGVPVVFAHSVLPVSSLQGEWRDLTRLASRPLGEALFANPSVVRTPLTFRKLQPGDMLYLRACLRMSARSAPLWARRSIFELHHSPIMVTEVFLPEILLL